MTGWWNNVTFAYEWALWGLLLVPLLAIGIWYFSGRNRPALHIYSLRFFSGLKTPLRVRLRPIVYVLRLSAIALLICAFARPQSKLAWKKNHGNGIDIMMCMDVSTSMNAYDFQPTRLEAAKQPASRFVSQRPDDRMHKQYGAAEAKE